MRRRYEHPLDRWDSMPRFVRWPLVVLFFAVVVFLATAPFHAWMSAQ